jgi:peptidoglycan/xylan/chitin deacetylase (PgdA/CDA1 family)
LAGVVLMYHDVAPTSGDPNRCVVPPLGIDLLRAQLDHLRRRYDVVSIHGLQERVVARAPGRRFPVALTFDDDLENHRALVAPLLSELELPATFFLTGSTLEEPQAFWWHDLNDLAARGGAAWREIAAECRRRWGSTDADVDLHALARTIEMMPPDERDSLARRLREIAGSPPRDRGLSESAVRDLVAAGYEIGFHTRAHYHLQTLDDDELHRAMREGAERLSAIAGHPLTAIAYPHGRADLRIAAAAVDAGFELGFVWSNLAVSAASHPMLMDRVDAWQPSDEAFAFRLARTISIAA